MTRALQHELDRRHHETVLCGRRLQEALDAAERWYTRREATLRRLDRHATATVRQLVTDGRVRPSLAWAT